jgi:hypothetical protein
MNLIDTERTFLSGAANSRSNSLPTAANIFGFKSSQLQQQSQQSSGNQGGGGGGGGQGLGAGAGSSLSSSSADADSTEGFTNFAPFAAITCTNPIGNPVDILVQNSGASSASSALTNNSAHHHHHHHRRMRSTIWSYHFQPDETRVGLSLTFPHAFLLKEVHIVPNTASISNIPAYVSVEVSRDGSSRLMTPVAPPLCTMGLAAIRLQLTKSELVAAVQINLYKAKDSLVVGLSHIRLLGYPMFENMLSAKPDMMLTPVEDLVARSNMGWLRLLHMCLPPAPATTIESSTTTSDDIVTRISDSTVLLCTRLLASPAMIIYDKVIEQILVRLARHSRAKALTIVASLLRTEHGSGQGVFGVPHGVLMETLVNILYQICDELSLVCDESGQVELATLMLAWVSEECFERKRTPSHMLLHCVATVFYHFKGEALANGKRFLLFHTP